MNIILVKYINNFKTKKFKYRYRFSIGIGFALKFNIGIGTGIGSNFGIGTSLISALRQKSKFKLFWKKKQFWGFYGVASTREDLSIDATITNVGLILTKIRWFQLFVKNQNSNFFEKNEFWGLHCVVLVKTIPLMHQFLM